MLTALPSIILTMKAILVVLAVFLPSACFAFSSISPAVTRCDTISALHLQNNNNNNDMPSTHLSDRRSAISTFTSMLPLSIFVSSVKPLPANASKGKVVVFGGSGWVGAHVCSNLNKQRYDVVSISRSTDDVQIARTKSILGSPLSGVQYLNLDAATAGNDDLSTAMKDSLAVISCVGIAPGGNVKEGNSIPNSNIAKAAKSAGVSKVVYIGVATSLSNGPAKFLLGDYFKGKADAENSFVKEFGKDKSLIIKPAIVDGGTPGEIRPPGPPGVKAVDVEALAKVVVSGAVGDLTGVIDGNEDITSMAL